MRKKKVLINAITSISSYIFLFVFGILIRKLFLNNFSLEFLGYEGLFSSIFLVLSVAEMGAGGMFNYMLYKALAKKDTKELAVIMGMYQKLYRVIGTFVLVAGTVVFFLLPVIIQEDIGNWSYVRVIYIIQLGSTLVTYFLAYRRAILIADQCSHEVVRIETMYKSISQLLRVGAILLLHSYIAYLLIPLATNLAASIHVGRRAAKKYPGVFSRKATWDDFKERKAFPQLRDLLISKVSTVMYTSTDNIMISALAGIRYVALYANYQQITTAVIQLLSFITEAIEKSTGNLVYAETEQKKKEFFDMFDFAGFCLGAFSLCAFVAVFQKTIIVLYGVEYLMPFATVVVIALDFYVRCRGMAYCAFQSAVGHYELGRWLSVAAAVSNLALSIILGLKWGITGILGATILGNVLIQAGRARVIFLLMFPESAWKVIRREIYYALLAIVCMVITILITQNIQSSVLGILGSLGICVVVCMVVIVIVFFKSKRFALLLEYIKMTFNMIKSRKKRGEMEEK